MRWKYTSHYRNRAQHRVLAFPYQWKIGPSGGPYVNVSGGSGATTASYTTSALTCRHILLCLGDHLYEFRSVISPMNFTLTVNPLPSLNLSPSGTTETCGNGKSIIYNDNRSRNTYIWKKMGHVISGENFFFLHSNNYRNI